MAKYLVETYYTCKFKVNHYLDDINETELINLEKREDGKEVQCKKTKSDGSRCKMKTSNKSGLCYYHD